MKKSIKKIIALLAVAALGLSLMACGSSGSDASDAADTDADAAVSAEAEAEETEDAEADEAEEDADTEEASDEDSDMAYVQDKGTLVVGITDFEPMDYQDEEGNWIGFDADLATQFAESLGVDVEFMEIDWDNKILELDGMTIDCVWNGMTLTDEVTSSMECSNAYCNNQQVVILPSDIADQYTDADSMMDLTFAVEAGSAGEEQANAYGFDYTPVQSQADALMEVAAGTSDGAIIDSLMAAAMVGEGTGYSDLTYTIGLNDEEYGVGFRKGSDLAAALNDFFAECYEDGTMESIADIYGVQASLIEQ